MHRSGVTWRMDQRATPILKSSVLLAARDHYVCEMSRLTV